MSESKINVVKETSEAKIVNPKAETDKKEVETVKPEVETDKKDAVTIKPEVDKEDKTDKPEDKMVNPMDSSIGDAFKPITDVFETIGNVPGEIIENIESAPATLVKGLEDANKELDKVVDATAALANPTRFGKIINNFAKIPNNINSKGLQNIATKFISGGLINAQTVLGRVLYSNPVTAIPLASAVSMANGVKNTTDAFEGASKIFADSLKTTAGQMTMGGGQQKRGGAKTRRLLKNIIRDRKLIQTRTNKMISEFTNPSLTRTNKKHISKKSKRIRRH
jgi:hypothetical protein